MFYYFIFSITIIYCSFICSDNTARFLLLFAFCSSWMVSSCSRLCNSVSFSPFSFSLISRIRSISLVSNLSDNNSKFYGCIPLVGWDLEFLHYLQMYASVGFARIWSEVCGPDGANGLLLLVWAESFLVFLFSSNTSSTNFEMLAFSNFIIWVISSAPMDFSTWIDFRRDTWHSFSCFKACSISSVCVVTSIGQVSTPK